MIFLTLVLSLVSLPATAEESDRFGPGKGVLAANERDGLRLGAEAAKNFAIVAKELAGPGPWRVPRAAVLSALEETNLYRLRDSFYKRIDFTELSREGSEILVKSEALRPGDAIVVSGVGFLRLAELNALGAEPAGHAH